MLQHRVDVDPFFLFLRPVRYVIDLNTISMQPDKVIFLSFKLERTYNFTFWSLAQDAALFGSL